MGVSTDVYTLPKLQARFPVMRDDCWGSYVDHMYTRNATASELVHMSAICRSFRIHPSGARMGRAGFIRGSLPNSRRA